MAGKSSRRAPNRSTALPTKGAARAANMADMFSDEAKVARPQPNS